MKNAIELIGLTKTFGKKTAVRSLDLTIGEGELFALLGTNGAGKTTTIKMMSTLIRPTAGEIRLLGLDALRNTEQIRPFLNVSPQETAIAPGLTVKENLAFMAGVYQIRNRKEKIDALIEQFQLSEVLSQKAKTLSGGWQRKVSIALSLINDPKILFLDEPTLGLDILARRELWSVIEQLKGQITILLTTHLMEEAEHLSDRIGIMNRGKLLVTGSAAELKAQTGTDSFEDAFVKLVTEVA